MKKYIMLFVCSITTLGFAQQKRFSELSIEENQTIGKMFSTTEKADTFVNQMNQENGTATIENVLLEKGNYKLDRVTNKLELQKVAADKEAVIDFNATKEIDITETTFLPSNEGNVLMMIQDFEKLNQEFKLSSTEKTETKLYPNPVIDFVSIKLASFYKDKTYVFVYDMTGKMLLSKEINKEEVLNWSNYSSGKYIIKIVSTNLEEVFSLLKQ